jgi:ankyrin repeat protein
MSSATFRLRAVIAALAVCAAGAALAVESLPDLVESMRRDEALRVIAAGGDVNERSVDGTTALHWAAHNGDLELVELLLERGADATVRNDYGMTAIAAAAVEGDRGIVKALIDASADVESPNAEGQTVLMAVARTGRIDTAELLLAHGADVNAKEQWGGQTALMWAAAQQQPQMIRVLLEHGARVNETGRAHDWQRWQTSEPRLKQLHVGGFSPLLYAARAGCVACARELVAGGADLELGDPRGITPLVMALLNRHFDTAAVLIESGADVNRWDWWGRSPLYVAIELNQIPDSRRRDLPALDSHTGLDIARMLLARGANVNMRLKQQPPMRSDPGDRGLTDGSPDVLVITTGATPLHPAVKASDDEAVKLLLKHGANPSAANVFGITPFMAAAGVGHWYGLFIAYPLIGRYKTGADAVETMKLLVAAGGRTDGRTADLSLGYQRPLVAGLTAAHGAAFQGWPEVIQYLHELGLDINAKQTSPDGMTPRDVAMAEQKPETAAFIDKLLTTEQVAQSH